MTVQERQTKLRQICQSLKETDSDIVDIIQFGSSVYAPDLARDVDLLITTHSSKDEDFYWDAFDDLDIGVDLIIRTPKEPMKDLASSVRLMGEVLSGTGETIKEAEAYMAPPTYHRAHLVLKSADTNLSSAKKSRNEILKDEYFKIAFNRLFDAARNAVMAYLNTENSRWGQLREALPKPYDRRFREIVVTLHILYSYDGKYPKDDPDGAFKKWRKKVQDFIQDLESKG